MLDSWRESELLPYVQVNSIGVLPLDKVPPNKLAAHLRTLHGKPTADRALKPISQSTGLRGKLTKIKPASRCYLFHC